MSNYVFIGHGWNLKSTVELSKYNCSVIMLSKARCLFEEHGRKHKQLITIYGKKPRVYIEKLFKEEKVQNEFCQYDDKAPELLLSTFPKIGEQSISFLQLIGSIKAENISKVFLLSEVLEYLHRKEDGKKFVLIIYACRCPLDHFQLENLDSFGESSAKIIQNFIGMKNIEILKNGDNGVEIDCKPLF